MNPEVYKLSPSDFAFLWQECKRCFYLKVVHNMKQPRSPMAKIFILIDSEMKRFYSDKRTETITEGIPEGRIEYSEKWVESVPFEVPGHRSKCFIRGKFDTAFHFEDGSYGVVDFKTSERNSAHIPLYSRQLHAYALALEHPAPEQLSLKPISKLGLLVFSPSTFTQGKTGMVGFAGRATWVEIPREDEKFFSFLAEVLDVLERPEPPAPSPECQWCSYREQSRKTGF
jgi:hypothetical protein